MRATKKHTTAYSNQVWVRCSVSLLVQFYYNNINFTLSILPTQLTGYWLLRCESYPCPGFDKASRSILLQRSQPHVHFAPPFRLLYNLFLYYYRNHQDTCTEDFHGGKSDGCGLEASHFGGSRHTHS